MTEQQTKFFDEWEAMGCENPIGRGRVINLCVVELYARMGRVRLSAIWSLEFGKGHASQTLQTILDLADRCGVEVELCPKPFIVRPGEKPPLKTMALKRWYCRHGFIPAPQNELLYHPKVLG